MLKVLCGTIDANKEPFILRLYDAFMFLLFCLVCFHCNV